MVNRNRQGSLTHKGQGATQAWQAGPWLPRTVPGVWVGGQTQ